MNLTTEQFADLASIAETLAINAQYLLSYPDAVETRRESWQSNVAWAARRIAEIVLPQNLNYKP